MMPKIKDLQPKNSPFEEGVFVHFPEACSVSEPSSSKRKLLSFKHWNWESEHIISEAWGCNVQHGFGSFLRDGQNSTPLFLRLIRLAKTSH
jgi:hypothetical protein